MKSAIGLVMMIVFSLPCASCMVYDYTVTTRYNIGAASRIDRAAHANTVELATKELDAALKYMESRGNTSGNTSILWEIPENDVAYYYTNIASSRDELKLVTAETSQLERTNQLMKLHETLEGTIPSGIQYHPYNVEFCIFCWISGISAIFAVLGLLILISEA